KQCREDSPTTAIVMITGQATAESAVEAMRLGAFDYLTKPFELEDLKRTMEHALGSAAVETSTISHAPATPKVIGRSEAIERILAIIQRVADSDSTVLLQGEFGVGKRLVCRALHDSSVRSSGPFKAIQCSALPPDLLEAELFGHGGAQNSVFERTRGGTIHVAEIHLMPLRIQAQLNAFLEAHMANSGGSGLDCRLVASTTVQLEDAIREQKFREDLYYKISVVPVVVPPLRQRREDIPLLVEHFLREHALRTATVMKRIEPYAEEFLDKYPWPGNISELRNAVERAIALADGPSIKPTDLPTKVTQKPEQVAPASGEERQRLPIGTKLEDYIRGQEKLFINETLKYNSGSREKTASMLGISIATLYRKMDLNIERRTTS
ncbi:MAG: sigma-54-dependent transcriptional regulator, partial [Roseimicrobium sp.]